MTLVIAEFVGTALLLLLGNGVNANVSLNKTYGNNSGWIVIALGWAVAVFVGVYVCASLGGDGHLNPAVTIADAIKTKDWSKAPWYIAAQMLGAMTGQRWPGYRIVLTLTKRQMLMPCWAFFAMHQQYPILSTT
jgi:glycerol uptake facilitator protein